MRLGIIAEKKTQVLLNDVMSRKLPAKTAFRLKTVVKKVREEIDKYNEVRDTALQRHGKKNSEGSLEMNSDGNVQFTQEGIQAFIAEMTELNNLDVEIPTLSIDEFMGVEFTGEELILLDGLIV